jgi:DNA-binding NarL/FixJ family response regulator
VKEINLLLVDDQVQVRRGLRMRLALERDMAVVGEAGDGTTAVALALACEPDVVVMDLEMPGMDGIEATQRITEAGACPVVVLSIHDSAADRLAARRAGAAAFVAKAEPAENLLAAIRNVARAQRRDA